MKQTLITRLVLGAIAGMAAMSANAGQIQASSVSIAREVITTDTQLVTAPSVAYRFAGDVDARSQAQTFQVQFNLAQGEWVLNGTTPEKAFSLTDGVSGTIISQGIDAVPANPYYTVDKIATDTTDKKILYVTITVNAGTMANLALIKQPVVSINVSSNNLAGATATNTAAFRSSIKGLKTIVGDLVADFAAGKCTDTKTLAVGFKHFVALTSPTSLATASNATADEHIRAGATNDATLVAFPTNIKIDVTTATAGAKLASGGNMKFVYAGGLPTTGGGISTSSWTGAATATPNVDVNNVANLGTVKLTQNAVGYDSDLANKYLLSVSGTSGLVTKTTADKTDGAVEATALTNIVVASSNGFVKGGSISLRAMPAATAIGVAPAVACSGAEVLKFDIDTDAKAAAASNTITVADPATVFGAAKAVQVCYVVPGDANVPAASFSSNVTLTKASGAEALGVNPSEQNNACGGNLFSLGGGLKIDVRNYASSQETSGYQSVIRLINNSDARPADVYGQIIHQNGQFGGYGLLATLKPREVLNMTAAQIDAKLTNAPAAAAAGDNGATTPAASATGAPRLRITSNSGASLRVQNYLFNSATQQIFEASNGQGVDFEGTTDRAPANDGQYISQDANSGLNGK